MELPNTKIIFLISISICSAWDLPPVDFVGEFSKSHNRQSVVIYSPKYNSSGYIPTQWQKLMQKNYEMKISHLFHNFVEINSTDKQDQDLHIFIPDDKTLNSKVDIFIDLYSSRKRSDKEYWLLDVSSIKNVFEELHDLSLDLDDDLYLYSINVLSSGIISIWEFYEIHSSLPRKLLTYGNWNSVNGLFIADKVKWNRRKNLDGLSLRIVCMPFSIYTISMNPINSAGDEFDMNGMFADFWFNLQEIMNFTYVLKKPPDGQWGVKKSDGSWSGMIGELLLEKADVGVSPFTVSFARSQVVSFSHPILQADHRLFIKNPIGNFNFQAYNEPLENLAWVFVGFFCLFTPPFLYLATYYGEKDPGFYEFTWIKSSVFVLSSLTTRGWSVTPTTNAARMAFFVIMLMSILIYYYWEAMLVSYLAARIIVLPFTGIETLMADSEYLIAVWPGTYSQAVFESSIDPVWQKAWNERMKPYMEDYIPYAESQNLIGIPLKNPTIAYYDNYESIAATPEYIACEVIAVTEKYDVKPWAYSFQKYSPYLEIFNHYMKLMEEKGTSHQILKKYESESQVCPDKSGSPIGFDSCCIAFLLLCGGLIIGGILLATEILISKIFRYDLSKLYERDVLRNDHICDNCGIIMKAMNYEISSSVPEKAFYKTP